MSLNFSERVLNLANEAQKSVAEQFARIDSIAEVNTRKVLAAFQKRRVAEGYFSGTTGYGYDDQGREELEKIYAEIFHTESALVRIQFVNGTHAIACALFGALMPGEILVSAVGAPYDTIQGVIGISGDGRGTLKDYGIGYCEVPLKDNAPDKEGLAKAVRDPHVKAVLIQRSKGYSTRATLSVEEIGELARIIKDNNSNAAVLVDNCYGEFVETIEPTEVGADLIVGSLIKNLGGGLAPTGGYIAGRSDLVEAAAQRLTVPGIGGECGCTYGAKIWDSNNKYRREIYQCNHRHGRHSGDGLGCKTPHLTADEIKTSFIGAFNSCIKNRKEIIDNCITAISKILDTSKLEKQAAELSEECAVVTELIRKCVDENAHISVDPKVYAEKYEQLADRYAKAKDKLDKTETEIANRNSRKNMIAAFLDELEKQERLITEFDTGLWNAVIESMTIYSKEHIVFKFKGGTEVKWSIV